MPPKRITPTLIGPVTGAPGLGAEASNQALRLSHITSELERRHDPTGRHAREYAAIDREIDRSRGTKRPVPAHPTFDGPRRVVPTVRQMRGGLRVEGGEGMPPMVYQRMLRFKVKPNKKYPFIINVHEHIQPKKREAAQTKKKRKKATRGGSSLLAPPSPPDHRLAEQSRREKRSTGLGEGSSKW